MHDIKEIACNSNTYRCDDQWLQEYLMIYELKSRVFVSCAS